MWRKGTLSHHCWNLNLLWQMWRTIWHASSLTKTENRTSMRSSNSPSSYFLEENKNTLLKIYQFSSVQFTQSCPTLCDPMNRSMPGLPVHHHLPEFTQTHVHQVSDAIQPSHPLSSPSPPAPNPSQHQSLFQ